MATANAVRPGAEQRTSIQSAASVPLALDEAVQEKRVKPDSNIIMSGFGSGLVWGTTLVHW